MVATSLNLSNEPPVLKYEAALKFEKPVDYIVEGHDLNAVSSTVFDVDRGEVLRQGTIRI